jgi:mRNA interferase HigB
MHVISYRRLREYAEKHANIRENLLEVQAVFPKAEAVGNFTVFNIKGNSYRLIVSIDYERKLIYVKYVLTHAKYDKEQWKNDSYF